MGLFEQYKESKHNDPDVLKKPSVSQQITELMADRKYYDYQPKKADIVINDEQKYTDTALV